MQRDVFKSLSYGSCSLRFWAHQDLVLSLDVQATGGSGMKGGRGAAGTPHDIALARARAEAHACMTPVRPDAKSCNQVAINDSYQCHFFLPR